MNLVFDVQFYVFVMCLWCVCDVFVQQFCNMSIIVRVDVVSLHPLSIVALLVSSCSLDCHAAKQSFLWSICSIAVQCGICKLALTPTSKVLDSRCFAAKYVSSGAWEADRRHEEVSAKGSWQHSCSVWFTIHTDREKDMQPMKQRHMIHLIHLIHEWYRLSMFILTPRYCESAENTMKQPDPGRWSVNFLKAKPERFRDFSLERCDLHKVEMSV